jgi:hypothetical protein
MNKQNIKNITHPKLLVFLLVLLFIPIALFTYNKYKDWDNAQLIKGLHKDFPVLVSEIEQATGLELEQKVDCSITSEKFSDGVRTCELSVAKATSQENIEKSLKIILGGGKFHEKEHNVTSNAYRVEYRSKKSCTLSGSETIYFSCITAVREANIDLARELFINN